MLKVASQEANPGGSWACSERRGLDSGMLRYLLSEFQPVYSSWSCCCWLEESWRHLDLTGMHLLSDDLMFRALDRYDLVENIALVPRN